MSIKIGLVEDNPALRKRFINNFKYFNDMELVMVAASGEEAIRKLEDMRSDLPEIIMMDIELPGINGIETTSRVKATYGDDIDILMLTIFEHTDKIMKSINAGAVGYLLKDESPQTLVKAIMELKDGGAPMSRKIARKLITQVGKGVDIDRALQREQKIAEYGLSEKELQVIEQLVEGKNYSEIAELMFISPHTVKTHIKNIYRKMHVHTRASVVKSAMDGSIV
ncbi:MAG: response regulator transcription factor [Cyclobacteriaceae bacterium]